MKREQLFNPEDKEELLDEGYEIARTASRILQENGFEAYAIGGCVRDLLLNLPPKDYDLSTNAAPQEILKLFERSSYPDTSEAFAVCRVKINDHELEIATFRRDIDAHLGRHQTSVELAGTLEDDVLRRDFTINALALDLINNQLIDYCGGIDDLERKVLRFVGEASLRIQEDPLRLLRAIRFKNRLDFNYESSTKKAIEEAVRRETLSSISAERLNQELTAILLQKNRAQALEDMDEMGILERLLPEVTAGHGVEQPREFHSEGDVWIHQLMVMEALKEEPSKELVWAELLHDIGKKDTQNLPEKEGERITFYGHDERSVELARQILNRLKFSNKEKEAILWLIGNHMKIYDLPKMKKSKQIKLLNHPNFPDLLDLLEADERGSHFLDDKGRPVQRNKGSEEIRAIYQEHLSKPPNERLKDIKTDLGIDGHILMESFALEGAQIGKVKKALEEAYQNGEFDDLESALEYAEKIVYSIKQDHH